MKATIRRLSLLGIVLLVGLGLPMAAVLGQPTTKVKITQAVASFAFLPIDVAERMGFFAAEGLEVEQIATRGGGPDLAALLAGEVDFNAAAGTYQVSAVRQARDLVNVCNFYKRNIIQVTMRKDVAERLGITSTSPLDAKLAALRGLTIGVTRPGALTDLQARYMARQAGLDPDQDVNIVAIGGGSALVAALERGDVDVIVISVPFAELPVARGVGILLINNAAGEDPNLDPFMMENIFTLPGFAEEHPDIVTKFVRAILRALDAMTKLDPEDIADLVAPDFEGVDRETRILGVNAVLPALNPSCLLTLEAVENTLNMIGETEISAEEIFKSFTDEFIRRAQSGE